MDPAVVERAFERGIAIVSRVDAEPVDVAHGRLGTRARREVRTRAVALVVQPCRAVLSSAAA